LWSRNFIIATLFAALTLISGCGFKPLYGTDNQPLVSTLASIDIGPIPNRLGRDVRNALVKVLRQPATQNQPSRYHLDVELRQTVQGVAIQDDDSITRFNFRLDANYVLTEKSTNTLITKSRVQTVAAYNVVDSEFATLIARRDVEERAAREIAEKIRVRLSLFLSRQSDS